MKRLQELKDKLLSPITVRALILIFLLWSTHAFAFIPKFPLKENNAESLAHVLYSKHLPKNSSKETTFKLTLDKRTSIKNSTPIQSAGEDNNINGLGPAKYLLKFSPDENNSTNSLITTKYLLKFLSDEDNNVKGLDRAQLPSIPQNIRQK